ncbi:MAG: Synerg-CTERM sorting domain-containing protein [Synergistaceae bacterium]|nr:Synerg-CTERM sorting domain-containing protein [Synergistaceae bacterium]
MKATTANAFIRESVDIISPASDMPFTISHFDGTKEINLTFKSGKATIFFDPSEFTFDSDEKTLTIKKEALDKIQPGSYEMKATQDIGEETADIVIKGNPEQKQEEKQEEQKQEEKKINAGKSSGGCNAGFGALAMLFAIPLFKKRK